MSDSVGYMTIVDFEFDILKIVVLKVRVAPELETFLPNGKALICSLSSFSALLFL
jgi:hypothetical protein